MKVEKFIIASCLIFTVSMKVFIVAFSGMQEGGKCIRIPRMISSNTEGMRTCFVLLRV